MSENKKHPQKSIFDICIPTALYQPTPIDSQMKQVFHHKFGWLDEDNKI